MARYVIAVGSNVGDRLDHLQTAGVFLRTLHEGEQVKREHKESPVFSKSSVFATSSIWETAPVGPSLHPFLNAVAVLNSSLSPQDLLSKLKAFEVTRGRPKEYERWAPRQLDMDIISADELVIQTHNLIIPHQEMTARRFVLVPMQEILPDWVHPVSGKTIDELVQSAPVLEMERVEKSW